jgi:hypothetical protein
MLVQKPRDPVPELFRYLHVAHGARIVEKLTSDFLAECSKKRACAATVSERNFSVETNGTSATF